MNQDDEALIERYLPHGVVLDANLLLLYFAGIDDPRAIARSKRLAACSEQDFNLLAALILRFKRLVTLPNILTEVSILALHDLGMGKAWLYAYFRVITAIVEVRIEEEYIPSRNVVGNEEFPRLGLTDIAIGEVSRGKYLVLSADLGLVKYLSGANIDVLNYNYSRPQ